ncbi:hypothetical protein CKAH01_01803 [Colletotrichum kahawae]|uniref:Uncharacterized protein n=1 Tax=Colletotrichum kahawae TaxID=34407 RepID=A0AAD9Y2R2_COLKA|nr:hypothetical protein CKAH01_01803 [Colletotrichum kahawae]
MSVGALLGAEQTPADGGTPTSRPPRLQLPFTGDMVVPGAQEPGLRRDGDGTAVLDSTMWKAQRLNPCLGERLI